MPFSFSFNPGDLLLFLRQYFPVVVGQVLCLVAVLLYVMFAYSVARRRGRKKQAEKRAAAYMGPYLASLAVPGLEFPLRQEQALVGRVRFAQVRITDRLPEWDTVSPQHARLELRGTRWVVVDGAAEGARSLNGVYVEGERTGENFVQDGATVAFGSVGFRFHARRPGAATEAGHA